MMEGKHLDEMTIAERDHLAQKIMDTLYELWGREHDVELTATLTRKEA